MPWGARVGCGPVIGLKYCAVGGWTFEQLAYIRVYISWHDRMVKMTDLRPVGASRVGSNPTVNIIFFYSI